MIAFPSGVRVWLATGQTDMCQRRFKNRKPPPWAVLREGVWA